VQPPGLTTPGETWGVADLVHEKAHPVDPNPGQAVLEWIQTKCIDCPLGKTTQSVHCIITGPCLRMRHRPSIHLVYR